MNFSCLVLIIARQDNTAQVMRTQQRSFSQSKHSSQLALSPPASPPPRIMPMLVSSFIALCLLSPVLSLPTTAAESINKPPVNQTFHPYNELHKLKKVRAYLKKINKPSVKTIQVFFFSFFVVSANSLVFLDRAFGSAMPFHLFSFRLRKMSDLFAFLFGRAQMAI